MPTAPHDRRSNITLSTAGDTTATSVRQQLAAVGYGEDFRPAPPPASLYCAACGSVSAVATFQDVWARRLERASDPSDMVLVFAARCPVCSHGGSAVLGFGPGCSQEDATIVAQIPDHSVHIVGPPVIVTRDPTQRAS